MGNCDITSYQLIMKLQLMNTADNKNTKLLVLVLYTLVQLLHLGPAKHLH